MPRVRPVTEQWIRTRRMQALGLVDMIHPEKLTPEVLSQKIAHVLFEGAGGAQNAWQVLDTDGLPQRQPLRGRRSAGEVGVMRPRRSTVGYLPKGYPRISETFITNEILELETLGPRTCASTR